MSNDFRSFLDKITKEMFPGNKPPKKEPKSPQEEKILSGWCVEWEEKENDIQERLEP